MPERALFMVHQKKKNPAHDSTGQGMESGQGNWPQEKGISLPAKINEQYEYRSLIFFHHIYGQV